MTGPDVTRGLRLVTYNVHACRGLDGRRSAERVAEVLAECRPDLIALQEVDVRRRRSGHVDQARRIADHLEMHCSFAAANPLRQGFYGNAVLSRHGLTTVKSARLPRPRGLPVESRSAVWVELADLSLQLVNTHLGLLRFERMRQLRELLSWLEPVSGPLILCGDFNALPGSPEHRLVSTQLSDALQGRKLATFQSGLPLWQLDHVFFSGGLEVVSCEVPSSRSIRMASDHLPLVVDFRLTESAQTAARSSPPA